jgi:NAD(P)-dependent dehydrogenase (short-subunit alcohol dehydrogenase family)
MSQTETALIVGAGTGLSASLARLFAVEGMKVAMSIQVHFDDADSARRPKRGPAH